jgi:hypothetical protein
MQLSWLVTVPGSWASSLLFIAVAAAGVAAGEQRKRNYTWQQLGIDPSQHRFGWVDRRGNALNVTQVLQPQLDPGSKVGGGWTAIDTQPIVCLQGQEGLLQQGSPRCSVQHKQHLRHYG